MMAVIPFYKFLAESLKILLNSLLFSFIMHSICFFAFFLFLHFTLPFYTAAMQDDLIQNDFPAGVEVKFIIPDLKF